MPSLFDDLQEQLDRIWEPSRRPNALEWAQDNVTLDKRFTPRPGRYDADYTPYLRQLHLWFSDPKIRQLTFVKSAQVGGTTWLANCLMWAISEDPGPILYVTSTNENAKSWSERELHPRLRSCHALKPLLPDNDDDFRKTEMHFATCTLKLVGACSEGNLASRPIRYLFADEVDKWPDDSSLEAPALELAMARLNFYRKISKACLASTPTVEAGAIWQQFLAGSQHRFHVTCPDCGHAQALRFERLRWPEHHRDLAGEWDLAGVERDTAYHCEACEAAWPQALQNDLVRHGEWIPGNPKAPADHISAHISALYSPQISWGDLARMFLQKKQSPGGLHDFYNNFLGIPWENRAAQVKEDAILALRDPSYRIAQLPPDIEPVILTLCADPGERSTHWTVEARIQTGESWVIDYGTVLAIEDLVSPEFLAARRYAFGEKTLAPTFGLIDSGWSAERVYSVCASSPGGLQLMPSKGSTASFGTWSQSAVNGYPTLRLVTYVDHTAKLELYLERINKKMPPLLHLPADTGNDFIQGHSGQQLLQNRNSRLAPYFWKKIAEDHFGDCTKLHGVAWWVLK
jgi:phage terminase large subunit GpA-like protein